MKAVGASLITCTESITRISVADIFEHIVSGLVGN
jgi:hypothetical protein